MDSLKNATIHYPANNRNSMTHLELKSFLKYLYFRDRKLWAAFFQKLDVDNSGNMAIDSGDLVLSEQDVLRLKKWLVEYKASQN